MADETPLTSTSFDGYNSRLQAAALGATRKAAGLPVDISFHRSMDQDLAVEIDAFSERVLSMTNKLLSLASTVDTTKGRREKGKNKLESQDDVTDNFHSLVVDAMDQLLEKTDSCLDEFLGKNKAPAIAINPPIVSTKKKSILGSGNDKAVIQHAANLSKPQLSFTKKVDNSDGPWYPTLSHKYNAKVPLGHVYTDETEGTNNIVANHPYRYEITHINYPERMFKPCTPMPPPSLEDTQATWVDTKEEFQRMLLKLKNATEIAVDLEHHSYRSYSGFLCLMQISDRNEDWVVDLLAVRDEMESLNEVFTDPEIIKVFHGADSDIIWLQQDFNLYIVNLFDTFHASKLLDFPRHGLANLLEMYCDFVPDKRYQLADWRIRPLPEDMLKYARSDTHFLLYIYDNLRNALLDRSKTQSQSRSPSPPVASSSTSTPPRSLLDEALSRSAETSLRVYSKEPYDAAEGSGSGGWDTLAKKWNKTALTAGGPGVGLGALQREVYRSVHWWRERAAREEDESTRYVLQNHVLFLMAEQPPADMAALLAIFKSSIPPIVKRRAKELLTVVKEAVKRGMAMSRMGGSGGKDDDNNLKEQTGSTTPPAVEKVQTQKDVVMLDEEIKKLEETDKKPNASIWGQGQNRVHSTSQSSLFGSSSTSSQTAKPVGYATTTSTLFGTSSGSHATVHVSSSTLKTTASISRPAGSGHQHFEELVAKINRSFSMAPAVPQIITTTPSQTIKNEEQQHQPEVDAASGMQVEIPYVAPSQRHSKQVIKEEIDTIIVVGQARQKKRKRKAGGGGGDPSSASPAAHAESDGKLDSNSREGTSQPAQQQQATASSSSSRHEDPATAEPFDFSAAPNILDDNPDLEDRKKKRQKKQNNKGGVFYGDFPAPPKAHSELTKGNQSHTFK
ncbi:hypothetical protein D9613_012206 [Agrocybe pediades]|uniref:HRDC domain-containing protein n=1 Tax=Agrocybe pediades TaxID=84607 RepID=A0A8H4R433_9AGAR|nr:hypothetical protein D9613_012206 [Agrocybe pediades]